MRNSGVDIVPTFLDIVKDHDPKNFKWRLGKTLLEHIKSLNLNGLTRFIEFTNYTNVPKDLEFSVYNVNYENENAKIGSWNPYRGLDMKKEVEWFGRKKGRLYDLPQKLTGRKFKVVTIISPPFVMRNVRKMQFEGFLIEMLKKIALVCILLTKTTAARNEVALSYHKVRGLYFLAVVFAVSIVILNPFTVKLYLYLMFNAILWRMYSMPMYTITN